MEFLSGGESCRAWLFMHESLGQPAPCIVMGHGFVLTRRCRLHELASSFAEAGYVVLVFDYRGFGDSDGQPRQRVSFCAQLQDWASAVAFARGRSEVDPSRITTWGFSLGAGHALTTAVRDPRVSAVVAIAPMFNGLSSTLAAMRHWSLVNLLRIVTRAAHDLLRGLLGIAPLTLPVAAPPGELGLLTSPDAYPGYRAIVPPDFEYETAARIGLLFWTYWPGRALPRFSRPVLVAPCKADAINPPKPTLRRARRCASAKLVELDCAHMEVVLEPHRSRVVDATLDFLAEAQCSGQVD